jgi:hypothetical protein
LIGSHVVDLRPIPGLPSFGVGSRQVLLLSTDCDCPSLGGRTRVRRRTCGAPPPMSGYRDLELSAVSWRAHSLGSPLSCGKSIEREAVDASDAKCKIDVERFVE